MKKSSIKTLFTKFLKILVFMCMFLSSSLLKADDPGISKVRIIQTGEKTYTFETDISQILLWTIQSPIFPDRFVTTEPIVLDDSGWLTIRIDFSTKGAPLSAHDEILLPWTRNAADVSVQWLDGDSYKGLFYRKLKGIHIPMENLMPVDKSTTEVFIENFKLGISHFPFHGLHLLFILSLVLFIPNKNVFQNLLFLSLGQMLAMLFVSIELNFSTLLFSDFLYVLLTLMISFCMYYHKEFKHLTIALFILGFIHGTSYISDSTLVEPLQIVQKQQALFAFNLAMDSGSFASGLLFLGLLRLKIKVPFHRKWRIFLIGSLSVFLFLLLGNEHVLKGQEQVLKTNPGSKITYKASVGSSIQDAVQGSSEMSSPIMVFLSVEPYEVRQEILFKARAANNLLAFSDDSKNSIGVSKQEEIKRNLLALIQNNDSMIIDQKLINAVEAKVNFVTLGPGGVSIRESAIEETLDDGLIGISLLYETDGFPENIKSIWTVFPSDAKHIEYQAVDPHSTVSRIVSEENNTFRWESKLKGYQIKAIEPIMAKPTPRPLISYLVWVILLMVLTRSLVQKKQLISKSAFLIFLLLGFTCYPFVRTAVETPFTPEGKPSKEKAELILNDLLSNVYRAFNRRNEDAVYDRLAMSVTQNQLNEIYLQNRQSMAIENRGGARANVDEVKLQNLFHVEKGDGDSYIGDAQWTIRGSVNHFGHTHYRQNKYHALVTFLVVDGIWKISDFEILDTERLY